MRTIPPGSGAGRAHSGLRHRYKRCIGVLSIPGDRRDQDILELGGIASGIFDEIFFREDPGTRGRPRGEVMNLLEEGALQGGASKERIHLVAGEREATAGCASLRASRAISSSSRLPTSKGLGADHLLRESEIRHQRAARAISPPPNKEIGMDSQPRRWALIVHGGAKEISPEEEQANREGCLEALAAGRAVLEAGGMRSMPRRRR
jgi:hypothetical protein